MQSIADFKRAAVPGSRWLCINRLYPETSGLRTITDGKTKLHFTGEHINGKKITNGGLDIPKVAECRIEGDSLHMLHTPGSDRVAWTWTLLSSNAEWYHTSPPRFFAASPLREGLRGPAGKPWCVYDRDKDRAVNAAGDAVDEGAAYFATQAEAEELVERLEPTGTTYYSYGAKPPQGEWAYEIDDDGIVYGDGPWPFHHWERGGPISVKVSPNTEYRSWGNEHVLLWPGRFGQLVADLHLYVRQQGGYAMVWRCRVEFDLLTDTFTVPEHCPPTLRAQATSKAQKILDLVAFGRQDRDTYLQPRNAHARYDAEKAAKAGEPYPERERRETPLPEATAPAADVQTVRQHGEVWQRVGPDEWLTAGPGDSKRPRIDRHDTAWVLRFGVVEPVDSRPLAELERIGAAMVGQKIVAPPGPHGYRPYELTVQHAEAGFLYGPTGRGYRNVVHLVDTGLLTARQGGLVDRAGRLICVGDLVHEYTNGRIGPEPAGKLVGAFRVVGFNSEAGVLFTDRYAEQGMPEAVAFPGDVEVVDRKSSVTVHPGGIKAPLYRITKTEARRRWDLDQYVAVANDRYDDGTPLYAMRPSHYRDQFPTFDAMVEASRDSRRPSAVYFSKPDPGFDLVADANAARSKVDGQFWMRLGPDEWLWMHADGAGRPCRHTHDTATMLQLGEVEVVYTQNTAEECERSTAEMVGRDIVVTGPTISGQVQMRVVDNTGGFLTGRAEGIGPFTIHLIDTRFTRYAEPAAEVEPDPWGPVLDRLGA